MKIVVVIPTYNEAENISQLIPDLSLQFDNFPQHDFAILVVDGNSPDGTGDVVLELSEQYPFTHLLLEEKKSGLGAAYLFGFKHAMEELDADVIVEMDADFQHKPEDLPKLIQALDEGADYVIGSRYVKGGSIPKEWAFYRKLLSFGGSIFSKIILGIYNINDFTTGYKASRVEGYLDRVDLNEVNSSGFAYKIDLLYKMQRLGAKIVEVPIKFGLRDRGDSKMERDNMLDSLRVVLLLRYQENKSFFKFIVVGFTGLFVDSGLFSFLRLTRLDSGLASAFSGFMGMVTTFSLNNIWSFGDRKLSGWQKNVSSFIVYFVSSYIPIIFRSWLIDFSIRRYGEGALVEYSAFFVGILVGLIWNYTVYSRVIWKKK
jgi:dolichol-phosphate mannosyltransferase